MSRFKEIRAARIRAALHDRFVDETLPNRIISETSLPFLSDLLVDICEDAIHFGMVAERGHLAGSIDHLLAGLGEDKRKAVVSLVGGTAIGDENATKVLADTLMEMGLLSEVLKAWARIIHPEYPLGPSPVWQAHYMPVLAQLAELVGTPGLPPGEPGANDP